MSTIEIRRHAYTKKGEARGKGTHLSVDGVRLARRVGDHLGPFDLVLTSHIPRTLETALAMGFAVDDQLEVLGDIPVAVWNEIGHHERWAWTEPFTMFADIITTGGPTEQLGRQQHLTWTNALESVPSNGNVLIISHGRIIEVGLVSCFPRANYATWGMPFQHCEGVRLTYTNGQFGDLHFLRQS
jgi:broad specificity phosphatase PhoE